VIFSVLNKTFLQAYHRLKVGYGTKCGSFLAIMWNIWTTLFLFSFWSRVVD